MSPIPIVEMCFDLTSYCLGSVTRDLHAQPPRSFFSCVSSALQPPCQFTQMWCMKPLAHSWPPHSLPGNWCLFLACVGSLLSTAADGLYLASFNELRVADVCLGSTFLVCVRISMLGLVCSSLRVYVCVCVCTHALVCALVVSMYWRIHLHEDKCVSM